MFQSSSVVTSNLQLLHFACHNVSFLKIFLDLDPIGIAHWQVCCSGGGAIDKMMLKLEDLSLYGGTDSTEVRVPSPSLLAYLRSL